MSSRAVRIWCVVAVGSSIGLVTTLAVAGMPLWLSALAMTWFTATATIAGVAWRTAREVDRNNAVPRERVIPNGRTPL